MEDLTVEVKDGKKLILRGEKRNDWHLAGVQLQFDDDGEGAWEGDMASEGEDTREVCKGIFELPEIVKVDEVKAKLEDGVWIVTLPKLFTKGGSRIIIPISN